MHMTLGTWQITIQRIPPTRAELASMYDRAAERWQPTLRRLRYDRVYTNLFAQLQADGLLRGLTSGGRVLDCGIGTAAFSLALVRTIATPVQIEGIDISAQMLAQARRNLRAAGIEPRLHQRDMRRLPCGRRRFDLVMSAHLLEHLDDPPAGLAEMARVLRPGAPLLVVVTRGNWFDALLRLKWRYTTITPTQLERWMRDLGLVNIRAYDLATERSPALLTSVACIGFKQ